ncbi:erythromycin esterase family protein [Chitinibacter tainanensis]|uniref:erythromycin esterase family protein n=1 Tax=Chitinibacter tainanensis TaxID=230667 RepID=UPI0023534CDE|nr:erythromycin esterase family protein [Chitinibacter tainanensis]
MRHTLLAVCVAAALAGCGEKAAKPEAASAVATVAETQAAQSWLKANVKPLNSLSAGEGVDNADLAEFASAIGDAKVVVLNESHYADANAFELMNRLVQYLHQQQGFDVLLIESAMFDVDGMWRSAVDKNASLAELAPGRVFYMYSQTESGRKVLQYLDQARTTAQPLQLAGFDIPLAGASSTHDLLPQLEAFLKQRGSSVVSQPAWAEYLAVAKKAISLNSEGAKLAEFNQVSAQLEKELCSDTAQPADVRQSAGWWCRQVRGIATNVMRQQHREDKNYDYRDTAMADNASWLLDNVFAGHKVIVWTNAAHGIPATTGTNPDTKQAIHSFGWHLQAKLGKDLYIASLLPLGGQINKYWDQGTAPVQWPADALASALKAAGLVQGFVNAPQDPAAVAGLSGPVLGKDLNGVFFYNEAKPATQGQYPILPLPN